MNLKRANVDDAEIISNIHALSWKVAFKGLLPQQYLDELKNDFWVGTFKEWMAKNALTAQLVYENNLAVGCISYGKSRDDLLPEWAEIVSIYVLPNYWGKGYGSKLLNTALLEIRQLDYKNAYLWVLEGNLNAKAFYENKGFFYNGDKYPFEIMGKPFVNLRYTITFDNQIKV